MSWTAPCSLGNQRQVGSSRRVEPPLYSGIPGTFEIKDGDFLCPVCFKVMDRAHVTTCGHSFCYTCIKQSLDTSSKCPKCNSDVKGIDSVIPNVIVDELILKRNTNRLTKPTDYGLATDWASPQGRLDLGQVELLMSILKERRDELEYRTQTGHRKVILEFLKDVEMRKRHEIHSITQELNTLEADILAVRRKLERHATEYACNSKQQVQLRANTQVRPEQREKARQHLKDLEEYYFTCRRSEAAGCCYTDAKGASLEDFSTTLVQLTNFTGFSLLATLQYNTDMYNVSPNSNIVSGIDFDKDSEYLAIAGVTRKIKIFDYNQVVEAVVDLHCPVTEISCQAKVSCIAWNRGHKYTLASSDYDGSITLWDVTSGTKKALYMEHEKRCWCIDFSHRDPTLLASGADDAKVKIWSINTNGAVATLNAKANICCVQFDPCCSFRLAYGCADHCVHYYDLRNQRQPLAKLHGHRKAVSFIKFMDNGELVSASVDSQLKLWKLDGLGSCVRTFQGHVNEKNFVGLATNGQYIACGSEDNTLRLFYKGFPRDLMRYKFDVIRSPWKAEDGGEEDSTEFVSAVSWKPNSNVVLAANSQGLVKVLELT